MDNREDLFASKYDNTHFKKNATKEQYLALIGEIEMTDEIYNSIICLLYEINCMDTLGNFIHNEMQKKKG